LIAGQTGRHPGNGRSDGGIEGIRGIEGIADDSHADKQQYQSHSFHNHPFHFVGYSNRHPAVLSLVLIGLIASTATDALTGQQV
jgi:hypothetical protein